MGINVTIQDPVKKTGAKINDERVQEVLIHPHPPEFDEHRTIPISQFFTDNGADTGGNDMRVVGSLSSPIDFYIQAREDADIFIKSFVVLISDNTMSLSQFGSGSALTNGIDFIVSGGDIGEVIMVESIQTNFDFIRLSGGTPAFGSGANSFSAPNVVGNNDAYFPFIDTSIIFGLEWGVRLRKQTKDRLIFRIKDNTSIGTNTFNIEAFGTKLITE